ncbi:putative colanic acid biosynthesis acetyltransferase [Bacteroides finegoldii]|uniref:putative colanic acid biosynthesis acetyltransferase n=1 Tax=Bacteroides finegoldii TaxID=338188 RepID=UPI00189EE2D0|nr:putative colanic acid biosynthesis acetyltransferase [Bacteroides finegoldii]
MNLSNYKEHRPKLLQRAIWYFINHTIFRCLKGGPFNQLRLAILRIFGATIDKDAYVYSSSTIFAPWNLKIGRACIGPNTCLYSKDIIQIGDDVVVSQGAFLCTASHDISSLMLPLVTRPIVIMNNVWVGSNTFIGMGVTLNEGVVVGATASVYKDVESWIVVGGNPAKFIKKRELKNE